MSSESTPEKSTSGDGSEEGSSADEPARGSILAPAPILFAAAFLIGLFLDRREPIEIGPRATTTGVGGLLFTVGTALLAGAIRTMRDAGMSPSHEDEPPKLLTDGPFAHSRNPIYLGNCLQYLGLSLLSNSAWPLLVLVPLLAYFERVIDREESFLASRFGEAFERYRESVPRWL